MYIAPRIVEGNIGPGITATFGRLQPVRSTLIWRITIVDLGPPAKNKVAKHTQQQSDVEMESAPSSAHFGRILPSQCRR